MNVMKIDLLKWFSAPMMVILMMLVSCEKMDMGSPYHEDGSDITAAEAVEIVRPIIHKYAEEGRFWSISRNPIPANTKLKYGPLGNYDPSSKNSGTFRSPKYKAWLIEIRPDSRINGSGQGSLIIFINVITGKYEEIDIDGEMSDIEWDESFYRITDSQVSLFNSPLTKASQISSMSPSSSSGQQFNTTY